MYWSYAAYQESREVEPTAAEINRERYHAELRDMEREGEIDRDMENYFIAEELGVTVEAVEMAAQELESHYRYQCLCRRVRQLEDDLFAEEVPF